MTRSRFTVAAAGSGLKADLSVDADLLNSFAKAAELLGLPGLEVQGFEGSAVQQAPAAAAPSQALIEAVRSLRSATVLVGRGLLDQHYRESFQALASRLGWGVLNTYDVKGLFPWTSPHHLASVGLQERDLELSSIPKGAIVATIGLDPCFAWLTAGRSRLEIPLTALAGLVEALGDLGPDALAEPIPAFPPLRRLLAELTEEGWAADASVSPAQVTRNYAAHTANQGCVMSSSGLHAYFIARTLPSSRLRQAIVPLSACKDEIAIAAGILVQLIEGGKVIVAIGEREREVDAADRMALVARAHGCSLIIERWREAEGGLDADAHAERLSSHQEGEVAMFDLPVSAEWLPSYLLAAGKILAFT